MQCITAWGQWAMKSLQCTPTLLEGGGQCNSCNALRHPLWGVAAQLLQCIASLPWGQWAVELLQCTASLPKGSGQWKSCNALPHCLGASGNGKPAMHSHTT